MPVTASPIQSSAERAARGRKARRLADVLEQHGATADVAAHLPQRGWDILAELAGVNPPSYRTRALAVSTLRMRAELASIDPFDGLPS